MADAKPSAGGGGWNWTSFESIFGIVILLAAINYMAGGGSLFSNQSQQTTYKENSIDTASKSCGLTITRPKSGSIINTIFNLTGQTNGCNWSSTSDTALFLQVVDAKGKPVSEFIKVPPLNFEEGKPTTFNSTIGVNGTPAKGTGYVILIPAQDEPNNPITYRIPVKFK